MVGLAKLRPTLCVLVAAAGLVHASSAAELAWQGKSNLGGGQVLYGYVQRSDDPDFNPEFEESMPLSISCHGFDGSLTVVVPDDLLQFDIGTKVAFEVDGIRYEYGAGVSFIGGDYTAVPMIEIGRGDPLLEALMSGSSAKVLVGGSERMDLNLRGTRDVMTTHLRDCL